MEQLTLNISEWPKDAAVCSLSDIVETGVLPQRYYLSQKACAGILRRAEKRGRQLPELLRRALQQAATIPARTEPASGHRITSEIAPTLNAGGNTTSAESIWRTMNRQRAKSRRSGAASARERSLFVLPAWRSYVRRICTRASGASDTLLDASQAKFW